MDISKFKKSEIQLAINTIKMLAVDAVEKAQSGHPGLPMGCADIAFIVWMNFLRFNPDDPSWPNRDRFILSAGHPEFRHTPGVETTTGPLGQGFVNATGMAMAESIMEERFNKIEAGSSLCWHKLIGRNGLVIGVDKYGVSAPVGVVAEKYGFTVENILQRIDKKWGM